MYKVNLIPTGCKTSLKSHLNPDLVAAPCEGRITLSGWAWDPDGARPGVVVKAAGTVFSTELTVTRPDVAAHLQQRGFGPDIPQPLGYRFDFLFSEGMEIGFRIGTRTEWLYRLEVDRPPFPVFADLEALLQAGEGACGNVYFHDGDDWSKVIILFNGALTPRKLTVEKAVFQRWSWAKQFRHPVFCIADPLTVDDRPIVLGWYLGAQGPNPLAALLAPILAAGRQRNPDCRFLGFGSSGGGFAALAGVLLGVLDEAIAINPQTDAMAFEVRSAVDAFVRKRQGAPADADLTRYDMSRMKPGARVHYVQNLRDGHHYERHYTPFRAACMAAGVADRFVFTIYDDPVAGHMPPGMAELAALPGLPFAGLLRDRAGAATG